ncbi:DUF664 domain-containing protein [Rothia nasimurium]|uniref:mycothiol transferase n=1 Tax=Rothia nasimurium TaxID=85336 RepID=UPI001F2F90A0|nr:DUF664 domain-containing protein [Rothia nasimurium]
MKMPFTDPPLTGSEKELVLGYIRFQQEVFLRKLQGVDGTWLDEAVLATPLHPSSMTLAGMAGHLWFVEDYWREEILLGRNLPEPWASFDWQQDADADWHLPLPLPRVLENLQASMEATRQLLAEHDWDDLSEGGLKDGTRFSYRWVALHLIEEWGRHLGHADLLRENIDGEQGD